MKISYNNIIKWIFKKNLIVIKKNIKFIKKNKNKEVLFNMLCDIGKVIFPEYRFNWYQMDWWNNKWFNQYLMKFNEIDGPNNKSQSYNTERRWMLFQLLRLVEKIPGDTAECGVYEGSSSYLICSSNKNNFYFTRRHFIFDSFEGLSKPNNFDGEHWTKGDLSCSLDNTREQLSDFKDCISYHKGWIPDTFSDIMQHSFSFVHIDVDLYQPTLDSIHFFYPRTNVGGIIVCDDYGCSTCPGATKAIDIYLESRKEKIISLPAGGGFLIKGVETKTPTFP